MLHQGDTPEEQKTRQGGEKYAQQEMALSTDQCPRSDDAVHGPGARSGDILRIKKNRGTRARRHRTQTGSRQVKKRECIRP